MPTINVGANRGIGLALVQKFTAQGWEVSGSARAQSKHDPSIQDVSCLRAMNICCNNIHKLEATGATIYWIDYLDEASIIEAVRQYGPRKLDCLIDCAGNTFVTVNLINFLNVI